MGHGPPKRSGRPSMRSGQTEKIAALFRSWSFFGGYINNLLNNSQSSLTMRLFEAVRFYQYTWNGVYYASTFINFSYHNTKTPSVLYLSRVEDTKID